MVTLKSWGRTRFHGFFQPEEPTGKKKEDKRNYLTEDQGNRRLHQTETIMLCKLMFQNSTVQNTEMFFHL